jgi:hypothetical protein
MPSESVSIVKTGRAMGRKPQPAAADCGVAHLGSA